MRGAQEGAQTEGGWRLVLPLALHLMAQGGATLGTLGLPLHATAAAQAAGLPMRQLCWPPLSLGAQSPGQKAAGQVMLMLVAAQAAEWMKKCPWWQTQYSAVQRAGQEVHVVAQAPEWTLAQLW